MSIAQLRWPGAASGTAPTATYRTIAPYILLCSAREEYLAWFRSRVSRVECVGVNSKSPFAVRKACLREAKADIETRREPTAAALGCNLLLNQARNCLVQIRCFSGNNTDDERALTVQGFQHGAPATVLCAAEAGVAERL
jgi:hypothetical protein